MSVLFLEQSKTMPWKTMLFESQNDDPCEVTVEKICVLPRQTPYPVPHSRPPNRGKRNEKNNVPLESCSLLMTHLDNSSNHFAVDMGALPFIIAGLQLEESFRFLPTMLRSQRDSRSVAVIL